MEQKSETYTNRGLRSDTRQQTEWLIKNMTHDEP
jgi:hypothetical protein